MHVMLERDVAIVAKPEPEVPDALHIGSGAHAWELSGRHKALDQAQRAVPQTKTGHVRGRQRSVLHRKAGSGLLLQSLFMQCEADILDHEHSMPSVLILFMHISWR